MNDLIEKLSDLRSQFNCFDENKYEAYRTLSEAIKVLSEEPKPCEDAVSRKEVLNLFAHNCDHVRPYMDTWEAVKRLTPVTPKRKTGKWIVHYECPKCGEITKDFTECCPFCGAEMDGNE